MTTSIKEAREKERLGQGSEEATELAGRATPDDRDHPFCAVPLDERRGPITMGLLWITMVTAFPSVLIGFQWYKDGLTLAQVVACTAISCLLLLLYAIPATQLGAVTGLNYGSLSRLVFGRWGARLVSFNLIWIFVSWYGLCALFMAEGLEGLFQWKAPLMVLSVVFAFLMAFNNFFGFKGVANFARFFAAPVLIVWVAYTFMKAASTCPVDALMAVPERSFGSALTTVTGFIIGFAIWGNEADYWRFGKPRVLNSAIPLIIALAIGQIIFPTAGFMVAMLSGITEYGAATSFMNEYSFGGMAIVGAIVLAASYFAANDSNLYGSVNACENLKKWTHKRWVTILAILGALMAAWLSISGASRSLEAIASLNCIILPTPTVIMIAEWFLMAKVFGRGSSFFKRVPEMDELPPVKTAALAALIVGLSVGVSTSGVIPGLEAWKVGICSVQAWAAALAVYLPLRVLEFRRQILLRRRALESLVAVPVTGKTCRQISCDAQPG